MKLSRRDLAALVPALAAAQSAAAQAKDKPTLASKNPGPERAQYFVMAIGREG